MYSGERSVPLGALVGVCNELLERHSALYNQPGQFWSRKTWPKYIWTSKQCQQKFGARTFKVWITTNSTSYHMQLVWHEITLTPYVLTLVINQICNLQVCPTFISAFGAQKRFIQPNRTILVTQNMAEIHLDIQAMPKKVWRKDKVWITTNSTRSLYPHFNYLVSVTAGGPVSPRGHM